LIETESPPKPSAAPFLWVLAGTGLFLAIQYGLALWKLSESSGAMANKFSALAREKHLGFLIQQNLWMLVAYIILALVGAWLAQPLITLWTRNPKRQGRLWVIGSGLAVAAVIHGYCTLRLMQTRPYFIQEAEFGQWYYKAFDFVPEAIKPGTMLALFTVLPIACIIAAAVWHAKRHGRRGWIAFASISIIICACSAYLNRQQAPAKITEGASTQPNILIIGSDSLRSDRLGFMGHKPQRSDGLAAAGVSPHIDALAAKSFQFHQCYTSIASTLESGVQLMSSQYPQSHGIRQMYPNRETVDAAKSRITPLADKLKPLGYDTAAIGDWCAGYYEVIPLGMEHISVSSFDNFKIYMSQAVVMSHFVIPLYFDNGLGYRIFPQLQSFAQFVTPRIVTDRVDQRLKQVAANPKPFFWHVFFSCNHLPYRTPEPYNSMFADPAYQGKNRTGVDFDIDRFIGGTDLESKWNALPQHEVGQIRDLYDGCTRYFDDCVGKILNSLKQTGLDRNTIVIITSDHGDDLYEPKVTLGHGLTFNGALNANHVPMVFHLPGSSPRAIPETVRLIDIAPTIANLVGIEPDPSWQGKSFAPWLDGSETAKHRPFYGETGFPFIQFRVPGIERPHLPPMDECTYIDEDYNYQFVVKPEFEQRIIDAKQRCLKTPRWKLVCTPTVAGTRHFELFHLASDPTAEHEVSAQHPAVLQGMQKALERWMDQHIETSIDDIFPAGEP